MGRNTAYSSTIQKKLQMNSCKPEIAFLTRHTVLRGKRDKESPAAPTPTPLDSAGAADGSINPNSTAAGSLLLVPVIGMCLHIKLKFSEYSCVLKAPKIMPMPLLKTKHHRGNMTLQQVPRPIQVQKVLESRQRVAIDVKISSGNNAEQKGLSSGQNVVTGWPAWLANVAPRVVGGWLPRRADSFEKLDKIGQGTYSVVYKARDLATGKIVALKKVRFVNMDPESVRFMAREIHILWRLDHPNVMKLEGIVTSHAS